MATRKLGRTGIAVSELGLGTEHLNGQPRDTVVDVVREAIKRGVNYYDIVFSFAEYRDNLAAAFAGHRESLILAGHIGCAETDGQYRKTRDVAECQALFADLLQRLGTEYLDLLFLQFVDEEDDYEQVMGAGGLLGLAQELQREGKTRGIGMSGHEAKVAARAVESGQIDVLMFPINLSWDSEPGRKELFGLCASRNVGLVGMKPYGGGELFRKEGQHAPDLGPVHCLSYALAQMGVSAVVPGVKNMEELQATLAYLDTAPAQRDYSALIESFQRDLKGTCVYCNHCLPCPVGIDVARTLRLLSASAAGVSDSLRAEYRALPALACACIACGDCEGRCPFSVEVIQRMEQVAHLFE